MLDSMTGYKPSTNWRGKQVRTGLRGLTARGYRRNTSRWGNVNAPKAPKSWSSEEWNCSSHVDHGGWAPQSVLRYHVDTLRLGRAGAHASLMARPYKRQTSRAHILKINRGTGGCARLGPPILILCRLTGYLPCCLSVGARYLLLMVVHWSVYVYVH